MKVCALAPLPLGCLNAHAQAAREFQRAPPDVFGLGVMTEMPGLIKSSQSLIPLGFPLRTRKTIVEVYGELLFGRRFCQSGGKLMIQSEIDQGTTVELLLPASRPAKAIRPEKPSVAEVSRLPRRSMLPSTPTSRTRQSPRG